MTPQESLDLLDNAVSQLNGTREVHIKIQEAISVLRGLVESQPKDTKTPPDVVKSP